MLLRGAVSYERGTPVDLACAVKEGAITSNLKEWLQCPYTTILKSRTVLGYLASAVQGYLAHKKFCFKSGGAGRAGGFKNRPHDAYPVRCRVPDYYQPCSERIRVGQLEKSRQLKRLTRSGGGG